MADSTPNPIEEVLKQAKEAASAIRASAKSVVDAIRTTRDAESARNLLGTLASLAREEAGISDADGAVVGGWVGEASAQCDELETETVTVRQNMAAEEQRLSTPQEKIRVTRELIEDLDSRGLLAEGQADFYRQIQPGENYEIIAYDENGRLMRDTNGKPMVKQIPGSQLLESEAILKAYEKKDDAQSKKALNRLLYNNDDGPRNDEERRIGEARLLQAIRDVEGGIAIKADDQKEVDNSQRRVKEEISAHQELFEKREIHRNNVENPETPKEVIKESKKELKKAEEKVEKIVEKNKIERDTDRRDDFLTASENAKNQATKTSPENAPLRKLPGREEEIRMIAEDTSKEIPFILREIKENSEPPLSSPNAMLTPDDQNMLRSTASLLAKAETPAQENGEMDKLSQIRAAFAENRVTFSTDAPSSKPQTLAAASAEMDFLASMGLMNDAIMPISTLPSQTAKAEAGKLTAQALATNLSDASNEMNLLLNMGMLSDTPPPAASKMPELAQSFEMMDTTTTTQPLAVPALSRSALGKA